MRVGCMSEFECGSNSTKVSFFSSKTFYLKTYLVMQVINLHDKHFVVKSFEAQILNLGQEGKTFDLCLS